MTVSGQKVGGLETLRWDKTLSSLCFPEEDGVLVPSGRGGGGEAAPTTVAEHALFTPEQISKSISIRAVNGPQMDNWLCFN